MQHTFAPSGHWNNEKRLTWPSPQTYIAKRTKILGFSEFVREFIPRANQGGAHQKHANEVLGSFTHRLRIHLHEKVEGAMTSIGVGHYEVDTPGAVYSHLEWLRT